MAKKQNVYIELNDCYALQVESIHGWHTTYFDKQFYPIVSRYQWHIAIKRRKVYIVSTVGSEHIYLHTLIVNPGMIMKGYEIDHIDGDSLNNRSSNLRFISRLENIHNTKVRSDNTTTGIRGVSHTSYNAWKCDFTYNKVRFISKDFKDLADAVYMRYCFEKRFSITICETNPIAIEILQNYNSPNKKYIEEFVDARIAEKINDLPH